jgi:YggT family protein
MIVVALTRGDVADYLQTLLIVYVVLIFIAVIVSFFPRIPYHRVSDALLTFVRDVTDPYLNLFRRFLPPVRLGPAALDLTPMVGTVVLLIVGGLIVSIVRG